MASRGEVTALDYTPTLVDWAERFSDLPGFVYLDSGTNANATDKVSAALAAFIARTAVWRVCGYRG